jgi:hypothetical protein
LFGRFFCGGFFFSGVLFEHLFDELGDGAFAAGGLSCFGFWGE